MPLVMTQYRGSRLSKVDQSNVLSPKALRNHPGWPFVRDAVQWAYKCGARAVFVYGSSRFDPMSAQDVDLLVCGAAERMRDIKTRDKVGAGAGEEALSKRVDPVLFPSLTHACWHVQHNIFRSYFVSRDGKVLLAKQALPLLMIEGGDGPQSEQPRYLKDEIPTYLEGLSFHIKCITFYLDSYRNLENAVLEDAAPRHFYPKADEFQWSMFLTSAGSQVRDGFYSVERVLKRICEVQGVEIYKTSNYHEEMIRQFHSNTKLRGFLPNQGQLSEEFALEDGPTSRNGELHRLRKVRNRWGEVVSIYPMEEVVEKEKLCIRELTQALKDLQVFYDAVAQALEDGKFDILLVK
jgi:hypothetical protein